MSIIPRLVAGYSGTAPTPTDPYFANVGALLHFDGSDAGTTFTDVTGKVWTASGNAQLDTSVKKYGTAAGLFDGTGDYISTPNHADFNFGTSDFTVEAFAYFNSVVDNQTIASNYQGVLNGWLLALEGGKMIFQCTGDGSDLVAATSLSTGQWYHIAVARAGTTLRLFVDGVLDGSITDSQNITSTAALVIGRLGGLSTYHMNGSIDEFRVTKGVARYTGAFTPPTAAHPDA